MAVSSKRLGFEGERSVVENMILEDRVERIQQDVADLKTDVHELNEGLSDHRVETEKTIGTVRGEVAGLRTDMEKGFGAVRTEIAGLRADMERADGGLRADMEKGFGALRAEITALRSDMEKGLGALRADMEKGFGALHVSMIRWMIGTMLSTATLAFGVAKFVK